MAGPLDDPTLLRFAALGPLSHPRRALLLAAVGGVPGAEGLPLGQRDAALMRLRAGWFGADCPGLDACPACARPVEFEVPLLALSNHAVPQDPGGWRKLTTVDLLAVEPLAAAAARLALARAVTGAPVPEADLPQVADWLTRTDPLVHVVLDLTCAHCGAGWGRPFDIVRHLWAELTFSARRLLSEIHLIARSYHWTEAEILAVPAARRRAYLDLIAP